MTFFQFCGTLPQLLWCMFSYNIWVMSIYLMMDYFYPFSPLKKRKVLFCTSWSNGRFVDRVLLLNIFWTFCLTMPNLVHYLFLESRFSPLGHVVKCQGQSVGLCTLDVLESNWELPNFLQWLLLDRRWLHFIFRWHRKLQTVIFVPCVVTQYLKYLYTFTKAALIR